MVEFDYVVFGASQPPSKIFAINKIDNICINNNGFINSTTTWDYNIFISIFK